MELDAATITAIGTAAFALISEIIGMNKKWKSNSVVQIVLTVLGSILKKKK